MLTLAAANGNPWNSSTTTLDAIGVYDHLVRFDRNYDGIYNLDDNLLFFPTEEMAIEHFNEYDANGDGEITYQEWSAVS